MRATFRYVLLTALRDRLFAGLFAVGLLAVLTSSFLGDAALVERGELTTVFAAASVRVILVLGIVLFVGFHVQRLYESREIEAILSRPLSREGFVLSYWLGLAAVALLLAVPVLALVAGAAGRVDGAGFLWWSASVLLEVLIVVALALFCSLTLERAIPSALAALSFYTLARMMSFLTAIADRPGMDNELHPLVGWVVKAVSLFMPRLDLFGQTAWLVYGPDAAFGLAVAGQAAIYVPLLLAAAMFDLRRKRF
ncbi:MAG: hypothetical protein HQL38_15020 [Alphaproteobacteria bacterium]|nr:hypothetical protein [Alphaproteobacteria bacterium]